MSANAQTAVVIVALVLLFLGYQCLAFVFGRFSYRISESSLKMYWRILRYIPIAYFKAGIDNVQEVRRGNLIRDLRFSGSVFGPLSVKRWVTIVFKKGVHWYLTLFVPVHRLYVSPKTPDRFIEELREAIAAHQQRQRGEGDQKR